MRKMIYVVMTLWISAFCAKPLRMQDVPRVMQQLMHYHIENKKITPTLVKRSFRIYLEQFDADKTYFYHSEIVPYFNMSTAQAEKISQKMQNGDFSEFQKLDVLIQKAITRSRNLRKKLASQYYEGKGRWSLSQNLSPYFAENEEELKNRIQLKMGRFFAYHHRRSNIDTVEKKQRLFQIYESKIEKGETPYLYSLGMKERQNRSLAENYCALRILKAFAKSLDAHTSFFSNEEAQEMRMSLEKQFEGIGVVLSEGIEGCIIAEIIPNSPAALSQKISVNDVLVSLNGKQVSEMGFEAILAELSNQEQKKVSLGIKKPFSSQKVHHVSLEKAPIVMEQDRLQYTYEPYEGGIIAKITLPSFYESSSGITSEKDLRAAITALQKIGTIKGIILDFRDNPGGFLTQAVKVTGIFISSGVVAISKYGKNDIHYLRKMDTHAQYSGPLIVLTSKLSASAAEIVAQSLQDYGAAVVVGDKTTFGKGSIQYQTVTDKNADYFYKVTIGRYYTVSGRSTQVEGVIADIEVPSAFAPFNIGERFLEYPLSPDHVSAVYQDKLTDLDDRAKRWFQSNYLPFLQKKINTWHKMLPTLKKRSSQRILTNPSFQSFLQKQKELRQKIQAKQPLALDPSSIFPKEDLQMQEAVNILKDMIEIKEQSHQPTISSLPQSEAA